MKTKFVVILMALLLLSFGVNARANYPESVQKTFWKDRMAGIVNNLLTRKAGTYPTLEIQKYRYKLETIISQAYGKKIDFTLVANRKSDGGAEVLAEIDMSSLAPKVIIFVPVFMDHYYLFKESKCVNWEQQFEFLVVVSIMHELEHLALKKLLFRTAEEVIPVEKTAWAKTCDYVIEPLIKKYGSDTISSCHLSYYTQWIVAKRDVDSFAWDKFIRRIYNK